MYAGKITQVSSNDIGLTVSIPFGTGKIYFLFRLAKPQNINIFCWNQHDRLEFSCIDLMYITFGIILTQNHAQENEYISYTDETKPSHATELINILFGNWLINEYS